MENNKFNSRATLWTSRVISVLCVLFLLVDAIMKVVKSTPSMEGTVQLGWPEDYVQGTGILLLICTIFYIVPRTNIIGALLLTGYLGGATAIMARADVSGHSYFFPIVFGILIWVPLFLRSEGLRILIPIRRDVQSSK